MSVSRSRWRISLIAPTLVSQAGHEWDYTAILLACCATSNLQRRCFCPPTDIRTPFAVEPAGHTWPLPGYSIATRGNRSLLSRFRRCLSRRALERNYACLFRTSRAHDLWFIHTAPLDVMKSVVAAWATAPAGVLVSMLRTVPCPHTPAFRRFLPWLILAHQIPGVVFVTDSALVAREILTYTNISLPVVPIPLTGGRLPHRPGAIFAYLGGRRRDKGFNCLPRCVAAISAAERGARFIIQCYRHPDDAVDPEVERAAVELAAMPRVTLIPTALSESGFTKLMRESAVVLLPYDENVYRYGSSGIAALAIANGRSLMHRSLPWVTWCQQQFGLSRILSDAFCDPDTVVAAARRAISLSYEPLSDAEHRFRAWHTPETLLASLCDLASHVDRP
jgi:hypothetical protein